MRKIKDWIKDKRKELVDPDNEGYTVDEALRHGWLDEGDQSKIQLLDELEDFIK